jgi:hypothetical protein
MRQTGEAWERGKMLTTISAWRFLFTFSDMGTCRSAPGKEETQKRTMAQTLLAQGVLLKSKGPTCLSSIDTLPYVHHDHPSKPSFPTARGLSCAFSFDETSYCFLYLLVRETCFLVSHVHLMQPFGVASSVSTSLGSWARA